MMDDVKSLKLKFDTYFGRLPMKCDTDTVKKK